MGCYDYRLHRGIEKYAIEHDWHLTANYARENVIPWTWEGDGVLAWLGAGDDLAEFVQRAKKPTVHFSLRHPRMQLTRVIENHLHAAELVAEHFISRGFTNFMFYSDANNWSSEERAWVCVEALRRSNHGCSWIRWYQSTAHRMDLEQWIDCESLIGSSLISIKRPRLHLLFLLANDDHPHETY